MPKNKHQTGLTLIESLVAVSILSLFVLIFGASYMYITTNSFIRERTLAYNLVTEEIEALRNIPFSQITDRTNEDFIEVQYNVGSWLVATHASPQTSPNVMSHNAASVNEDAQIILPGYEHSDVTVESAMYVPASSPSGWENGLLVRYRDSQNFYHVYFSNNTLYIAENIDGTPEILNSKILTFNTNTWYDIKVIITGSTIDAYVDDVLELSGTDMQSSLDKGRLAISSSNGSHLVVDDVSFIDTTSLNWNFDSDTVSSVPTGWIRLGINDLHQGATKLSITDDQIGYTDIKRVTASVEWFYRDQVRSVEIIALITR